MMKEKEKEEKKREEKESATPNTPANQYFKTHE